MTPEQLQRVRQIFEQAMRRPEGERRAFVAEACPDDVGIRAEVERLVSEVTGDTLSKGARRLAGSSLDESSKAGGEHRIGRTLSHYKILDELSRGGMGIVYRAVDMKLNRDVAIKVLPAELVSDPDRKRRFVKEAQAAAALKDANIAVIYEVDEVEGETFIAMELIEGDKLRDLIHRQPMSVDRALQIATDVGRGLAKAHEKNIVHRDIKPSNIMITEEGQAKVIDFGLAKLLPQRGSDPDERTATREGTEAGTVLGTVAFMSPEQARGEVLDGRTDIWSLGVVLYEMLAQRAPFRGANEAAVMHAILYEEPEPVSGLDPALERVLRRTLAKSKDERYQSIDEALEDLARVRVARSRSELADRKTVAVDHGLALHRKSQVHILAYVVAVVVIAVLVGAGLLWRTTSSKSGDKSVAVLPFENLSSDAESDYFSDGIAEDLLTHLSKIGDLRVVPSVATAGYASGDKTPREIGSELNVGTVLAGSVRRFENRVRIACQLIETRTSTQIWAETYDRDLEDVFAIQSEIAREIAAKLEANLSPEEEARIVRRPTASLTAYDYYLRGREFYYRYTKQDNEKAIEMFQHAIELDEGYSVAWAGLADAYSQSAVRFGARASRVDEALETARRATALDPSSAEAFKALGLAHVYQGHYRKGVEAYRRAIELNPNHFGAVTNLGAIYMYLGRLDEAVHWLRKSAGLNPIHANTYAILGDTYRLLDLPAEAERWLTALDQSPQGLGLLYVSQGEDALAMEQVDRVLELDPENPLELERAAEIARYTGDWERTEELYARAMANYEDIESSPDAEAPIGLGYIFLQEGRLDEAEELLQRSLVLRMSELEKGNDEYFPRYELALIHAIQGDKEGAYRWLREAIAAGWRDYRLAMREPWFAALHGEPQFLELMAEVQTMVEEMRARVLSQDEA